MKSRRSHWIIATLVMLFSAAAIRAGPAELDACAARVRDHPDKLESYMCYWFAARGGDLDGAMCALEALLAIDPANQRARLYLAAIHGDLGRESAKDLYREAAGGFADQEEFTGEVYARLSLTHLLLRAEQPDEAERELERAGIAARKADDPILQARVWSFQASRAMWRGAHAEALAHLRRAEEVAFPDGPVDLRGGILSRMARAYQDQGLIERARETFIREAKLMGSAGDAHEESIARLNAANLSGRLVIDGRLQAEEILEDLRLAVEAARKVGNPSGEARAHLLLSRFDASPEAIEHAEQSLRIYRAIGHQRAARNAMRDLALILWTTSSERKAEALQLLDEAITGARRYGDVEGLARAQVDRAILLQEADSRDEWIEASLTAVDGVERIRDLQPGGIVGARLFTGWSSAYYRFSGALLQDLTESPAPDADLEAAFRTIERMRSRLLLDEMDGAEAEPPTLESVPEAQRRAEVLEQIAAIQKRLADPTLPLSQRAEDLEVLERLETEEALLRSAVARADPVFAAWRMPAIPTLAEAQERLAPDQAILLFQVAHSFSTGVRPLFTGGSWSIAITRDGVRAFALPDRRELRERVGIFVGLCRRRDGTEAAAGVALYEDLLSEPLRWMGDKVQRLILVPDGSLHGLPFAALRPARDEPPLGVTHRLSRAPSATFWMRWKESANTGEAAGPPAAVFALADPDLPGTAGVDTTRSAKPWLEGLRLGALPRARREAHALLRALGGEGRVVEGADASEKLVKEADLARFRILHLAAHAVVDEQHPNRSAVVLAPGDEREDGFLQVREIVDLDVDDTVVILSACRSASGTVLRGSAMLGLGQGFLQAGARAVVGNLWPMRDEEAEPFVRDLGSSLADGSSLATAVAEARASRMGAGEPAAAWAGMVVLGDGDFVPVPGGAPGRLASRITPLIVVGLVILTVSVIALRRRPRTAP